MESCDTCAQRLFLSIEYDSYNKYVYKIQYRYQRHILMYAHTKICTHGQGANRMEKHARVSAGKLKTAREDVRTWDNAVDLYMRLRQLDTHDPYWDEQLKRVKGIRDKSLEHLHFLDVAADKRAHAYHTCTRVLNLLSS